ncbi:Ribonuclease P protein subunit p29 [Gracilariopsis chorda]|uniref:Ribonuclease P protein subunit p29 n=1 Tax=Gracilariopsis chorda TaxID=448386 RepID=A0A2V3IKS2_9FLOR|nr:Ribonuclease P protein subunit p29 [Gracilariopsis chorda]|eukprot:PXF42667.1 Ribonuclease P protein subunit p29 [Gracilariopsis chorda]
MANKREATLYEPVPSRLGGENARAKSASISRLLPYPEGASRPTDAELNSAIRNKTLLLQDIPRGASNEKDKQVRRTQVAREGKVVLRAEEAKFETYKQLHDLWLSYARKVFRETGQALGDRVLRMDWHGALAHVVRSKDPGLVGATGILVAETANTVVLVTRRNRAITVPKNVSVMQFTVDNHTVELILPALCFRASERSARKIKKKHNNYL